MEITSNYPELAPDERLFKKYNNEILMKILSDNKDTVFGREHGFAGITSPEDYRGLVKVSVYDDFRPFVDRIVKGEKDVLSSYEQYCLLETSGSTDTGKLIPITKEALSRYGNVMDRYLEINAEINGGKRLILSFLGAELSSPLLPTDKMLYTASYYRFLLEEGILSPETLAGGSVLNFFPRLCDYFYAKLWLAFASEDLISLEAVYLYDFVLFFHYMEESYKKVLSDMEAGRISEDVDLPEEAKEYLLSLKTDHGRITKIRNECEMGFSNIVNRLWSRIGLISGIGSKAFMTEEISIKKYTGDLPIWHYIYAASECLMAVPSGPDSYDYVLYPGSAYYEFRPEKGDANVTVEVSDLKAGECYEPVITTFSGLYRYAMGDILKVTGFFGDLPILRFQYRTNLVLNIAGEKLDMKTLDRAVCGWAETCKAPVWQYYFYEDYDTLPASYHGIIAMETDTKADADEVSEIIDSILRKQSHDYDDLRRLDSISMVKVSFTDKNGFIDIQSKMNNRGQPKPIHIIR